MDGIFLMPDLGMESGSSQWAAMREWKYEMTWYPLDPCNQLQNAGVINLFMKLRKMFGKMFTAYPELKGTQMGQPRILVYPSFEKTQKNVSFCAIQVGLFCFWKSNFKMAPVCKNGNFYLYFSHRFMYFAHPISHFCPHHFFFQK